jgi:hypothetical protein
MIDKQKKDSIVIQQVTWLNQKLYLLACNVVQSGGTLHDGLLFRLLYEAEDEGDYFLRNVGW